MTSLASYAALGLVHSLNPLASGGAEHDPTKQSTSSSTSTAEASHPSQASTAAPIPKGYGKIIRDIEGNVVRVELNADDEQHVEEQAADGMQGLQEAEVDREVMANWVTKLGGGRGSGAAIVECESLCSFLLSLLVFSTSGPCHCCESCLRRSRLNGVSHGKPRVLHIRRV